MSYADDSIKNQKHSSQTVIAPGPLGAGTQNNNGVTKPAQTSTNPMTMAKKGQIQRRITHA